MRDLGALWKAYQADRYGGWAYEKRVIVNGEIYTENETKGFTRQAGLVLDDFTIGTCVSSRLDATLNVKNGITIPKAARVEPQARIMGGSGSTAWVTLGTYYIDARKRVKDRLQIECYDAMVLTEQPYLFDGELLDDYPMSAQQAVQRIVDAMGVTLDPRTVLNPDVKVLYPNKLTMREVLSFVASAHGGSFCITDDNRLRLVIPRNDAPLYAVTGGDFKSVADNGGKRIDRLYFEATDDGDTYEAGTGNTSLEVFNLFATQTTANHVFDIVNGYTYNSYAVESADIDPALELGDSISVNGMQVNLWAMRWTSRLYCDISAPTVGDTSREFGFTGTTSSALKRRVALDSKYFGVTISRTHGIQIEHADGETTGLTTINSKLWEITIDGNRVLWADWINKTLNFNGKLSADVLEAISNVITPYIYSENGAIVNAVVRRLRTDLSKPFKHLAGDSSDVHWQDIGDTETSSGRYFRVSRALSDAPPVQFSIPSVEGVAGNAPMWWYKGVVGGSMTTSEESSIPEDRGGSTPVMVYQYEDITLNKKELTRTAEGAWGVREQWGEDGRGAGVIEKTEEYMQFTMDAGADEEIGGFRISEEKGIELYNKSLAQWEYPAYSSDILALTGEHVLLDHTPTQDEADLLPDNAIILTYDPNKPFLSGVYHITHGFVKNPTGGGGTTPPLDGIPGVGDTPGDYVVMYTTDSWTHSIDWEQDQFGYLYSGRLPEGHVPDVLSSIGMGVTTRRRNINSLHNIKLAPGQRLAQFRSIYGDYNNLYRKTSGAGGFFGSMVDLPSDADLVELPLMVSFVKSVAIGGTFSNSMYIAIDEFMTGAGLWTKDDFFFGAFDLRKSSPISYSYGNYGVAPDAPHGSTSIDSWYMSITGATRVYRDDVYTVFKFDSASGIVDFEEWKKGGYVRNWYYNQLGSRGPYLYVFRLWEHGENGNRIALT